MRCEAQSGFSLVEVIIFIIIVSVALAGVLGVMNLTILHSADPLIRKQSIAVAESLLEEIEQQNFSNPTGGYSCAATCTQADRARMDDVSDYDKFSTNGIYPIDSAVLIPGLTAYNVSVSVTGAALGGIAATDSKLITVTVTGPDGVSVAIAGYRTNYGS